ncbi:unnamed protein product, partial [marine sediment metagenome]
MFITLNLSIDKNKRFKMPEEGLSKIIELNEDLIEN